MNTPIQGKATQELLNEYSVRIGETDIYLLSQSEDYQWLRSAMRSLIQHIIDEMPKREIPDSVQTNQMEILEAISYNNGRSDCLAVLTRERDAI
jgi:hypothetical protein